MSLGDIFAEIIGDAKLELGISIAGRSVDLPDFQRGFELSRLIGGCPAIDLRSKHGDRRKRENQGGWQIRDHNWSCDDQLGGGGW